MTDPQATADRPSTRDALLDAAERLFAEHGVANASLRAITQEADANLAAVHYHFGSKVELVRAVFSRRLGPLNQERLARLERCVEASRATGEPPDLRCVLAAFVGPVIEMLHAEKGAPDFARVVGRAFSRPSEGVRSLLLEEFREVKERFWSALGTALPHLDRSDIFWRFQFLIGAMAHTAACDDLPELAAAAGAPAACRNDEPTLLTEQLLAFLEGAMRAPAAAAPEEETP